MLLNYTFLITKEVIFHRYFTYSVSTCHSFIAHKKITRCWIPRVMIFKSDFPLCCDVFIRLSELKRACRSHTFGYTNEITSKVIQICNLYRHSNAIIRQSNLCIAPLWRRFFGNKLNHSYNFGFLRKKTRRVVSCKMIDDTCLKETFMGDDWRLRCHTLKSVKYAKSKAFTNHASVDETRHLIWLSESRLTICVCVKQFDLV